jgi:ABC-type Fe3+-hydroxamate transport system substrate-binding protein
VNLGQLLALQTIPFASPIDHYWTDYYRSKYSDEVKVPLSHQYDFNRKALREAKPDYIIGIDGFVPPEEQEELHRIAPSLFLPWEENWRTHLLLVAEFIDRTEEAVKWLSRYDRKASSIRESIAPIIGEDKLLVLMVSGDEIHAWGNRAGSVFYDDLRIGMPAHVADFSWKERVGLHELPEFGANRILVQVDGDATSQKTWNQLSRKDDWLKLEAVHNRKLNVVTDYPGFQAPWNEYSADNRDRFLNEIPALFGIGGSRQ